MTKLNIVDKPDVKKKFANICYNLCIMFVQSERVSILHNIKSSSYKYYLREMCGIMFF